MERRANRLLFHTADQIRDATVKIKESHVCTSGVTTARPAPLLQKVPEETRDRITQNHKISAVWVWEWEVKVDSALRTCYSASAELINSATEDLKCFAKFCGALNQQHQGIL